jgi:hypothetical protein
MNRNGATQVTACLLLLAFSVTTSWSREPAGKTRNVLLIMSDDLKASVLPAYGNTVQGTNGGREVRVRSPDTPRCSEHEDKQSNLTRNLGP